VLTHVAPPLLAFAACSSTPVAPPTVLITSGPAPASVPVPEPEAHASAPRKAARPIAWETSEPDARERARRAGLPMIVWARAEWAAAAVRMEREVWSDPRVEKAARPFVALRLDLTAAEGDAERYAERYEITGMPFTVLLDARGRRVASLFGYQDVDKVVAALLRTAEE
jgi:thiol:disulfide interchange protein